MSEQNEQSPEEFFPTRETFTDFAGRHRDFRIELGDHPGGYFLRATEVRPSESNGGYAFATYSPTDPFIALGLLRDKIRQGLSTRYLSTEEYGRGLSHDLLKGYISFEGVVVDGVFLSFEELCSILETYEGFQFSLTIADLYDEL